MNLDGMREQAQMSAMLYHDNSALAKIRHSSDQQGALKEVAGQFEAMFLQLVLRQMRSSSDVLADEDSPFSSQQYGVFRDMHDGQLAIEMARKQNAGIADMLVKQLSPSVPTAPMTSQVSPQAPEPKKSVSESVVNLLPTFDAANDEHCVIKAEARSQAHVSPDFSRCSSVNKADDEVASQNKQRNEVVTTTAFSQPLIRRLEL
ncbi:rod-binding protein [Grimontia marina]|uniref:Peptidoglycan hydrolase FlgJ n=1 Tax=Grimontia marina TaxID=646534 RepID=A0A128FCB5_9GAMM|nr:rod-binding protein [Grimontia marina]CZF84140.1 Peptidoglycan hydrolase FlgJ [Grimontia marina]